MNQTPLSEAEQIEIINDAVTHIYAIMRSVVRNGGTVEQTVDEFTFVIGHSCREGLAQGLTPAEFRAQLLPAPQP
jgi:hypothetical protein